VVFNFRYSTKTDDADLAHRVEAILQRHGLDYELEWNLSGRPFLTPDGELVQAARQAISETLGYETELSTAGGTSDGRFIAPTGAQVVELGPRNATIHKIDERVAVEDLAHLAAVYRRILVNLLT
jgi:succinyl-diaminopimelate desuccinylase